ncbi:uncharacterized protein B0T15DRAFT_513134 [Chaetomium strumarium]|uniref:F-box domain-containing protein n=1 Tax=Chaetomium strumarium TaxID=1170767 RepID=A0AAJ0GMZ5_9PEZI|nr:hypothetical protein B0T15DRAFT_513134 [Chaetomium strumarium]
MSLPRGLPVALLDKLYAYLEPDDLFALCQSFGKLDAEALEHIGSRYFGELELLVTSDGLSALESVAAHPVLCNFVREVWITAAMFEKLASHNVDPTVTEDLRRKELGSTDKGIPQVTLEARRRYGQYLAAMMDHRNLIETPALRRLSGEEWASIHNSAGLASLTELHLWIRTPKPYLAEADTIYDHVVRIVISAAPNLEVLVFSQSPHFDAVEEAEWARMRRHESFKVSGIVQDPEKERRERESLDMWRDMLCFIRDNLKGLTYLELRLLQTEYTDRIGKGFLHFVDTYNGPDGEDKLSARADTTQVFVAASTRIPVSDWIDRLDLVSFDGKE